MKFTTVVLVASAVVNATTTNAPSDPFQSLYYDACHAPDGPCTKLDQAIASGRGYLNNPWGGKHDDKSKRAEEYLSDALSTAASRDVPAMKKRSPRPWWFGHYCGWVGEGCGKVRRSAAAIQDILGDQGLQKRWAQPFAGSYCGSGDACAKAKRSIDHLLAASNEVLEGLPLKEE